METITTRLKTGSATLWVGFLLLLSWLLRCYHLACYGPAMLKPEGWRVSEMLINFQGGYVRRGLLGEGLWQLCQATGTSPLPWIIVLSLTVFLLALLFFWRATSRAGVSWWILLTPWMFGEIWYVVGRDFLLVLLMMMAMAAVSSGEGRKGLRLLAVTWLVIAGMMVHEAFIFWGVAPAVCWWLCRKEGSRAGAWTLIILALGFFAVQTVYKGDMAAAEAIRQSWDGLMPMEGEPPAAIGAIGWDAGQTFLFHLKMNFGVPDGQMIAGLFIRPLTWLMAYYLFVFFLGRHCDPRGRSAIGGFFILQTVTLLPMFTILCCDYSRLYQYITLPLVWWWCMAGQQRFAEMVPALLQRWAGWLNRHLARLVAPTMGALVLLIFFTAESHSYFDPSAAFINSPAGELLFTLTRLFLYSSVGGG